MYIGSNSQSAMTPLSVRLLVTILEGFCSMVTNNFAVGW